MDIKKIRNIVKLFDGIAGAALNAVVENGELSPSEAAEIIVEQRSPAMTFAAARSKCSEYLRQMAKNGLLIMRQDGRSHKYTVNRKNYRAAVAAMGKLENIN